MKWTREKALLDVSVITVFQYLIQFLFMVRGFIFAKFLGPALFGVWSSIYLIYSYGLYAHLGITDGVSRLVPYYIGAGDDKKVYNFLRTGWTSVNFFSLIFLVSILIYAFISPFETIVKYRFAVILTGLSVLFYQNLSYIATHIRLRHEFIRASFLQLLDTLLELIFSIVFLFIFGINGLFFGIALGLFVANSIAIRQRGNLDFGFDLRAFREIFSVGFVIFLVGLTYVFLFTLDKFSVANFFTKEKMGYYSLAYSLALIPYIIAITINQVSNQRMLEEYGKTGNVQSLKVFLDETNLVIAFGVPFVSNLTITFAEPFILLLLPEYAFSLRMVDKITVAFYFFSLGAVGGAFLVALNEQFKLFLLQAFIIPFMFLLNYLIAKIGFDVHWIAYVTLAGFFIRAMWIFLLSYGKYYKFWGSFLMFVKFSLPVLAIAVVFAVKLITSDYYLRFLLRAILTLSWGLLAYFYLKRKTRIVSDVIDIVERKLYGLVSKGGM